MNSKMFVVRRFRTEAQARAYHKAVEKAGRVASKPVRSALGWTIASTRAKVLLKAARNHGPDSSPVPPGFSIFQSDLPTLEVAQETVRVLRGKGKEAMVTSRRHPKTGRKTYTVWYRLVRRNLGPTSHRRHYSDDMARASLHARQGNKRSALYYGGRAAGHKYAAGDAGSEPYNPSAKELGDNPGRAGLDERAKNLSSWSKDALKARVKQLYRIVDVRDADKGTLMAMILEAEGYYRKQKAQPNPGSTRALRFPLSLLESLRNQYDHTGLENDYRVWMSFGPNQQHAHLNMAAAETYNSQTARLLNVRVDQRGGWGKLRAPDIGEILNQARYELHSAGVKPNAGRIERTGRPERPEGRRGKDKASAKGKQKGPPCAICGKPTRPDGACFHCYIAAKKADRARGGRAHWAASPNPGTDMGSIVKTNDFKKGLKLYHQIHGCDPKSIKRTILRMGPNDKKVTGRVVLVGLGKAPAESYEPPKGSRKEGHIYVHPYDNKPDKVTTIDGKLILTMPGSHGIKAGADGEAWIHG